jgi:hypothetical protein
MWVFNQAQSQSNFSVCRKFFGPTSHMSSCSRCGESSTGPLADQVALEFGQGSHQVKNQLPAWCSRVNFLCQTDKIDALIFEEIECLDEVFERTPQTVELPDDHGIPRPCKCQQCSNPLRSNFEPVMTSLKYLSQPASFNASL